MYLQIFRTNVSGIFAAAEPLFIKKHRLHPKESRDSLFPSDADLYCVQIISNQTRKSNFPLSFYSIHPFYDFRKSFFRFSAWISLTNEGKRGYTEKTKRIPSRKELFGAYFVWDEMKICKDIRKDMWI
jgi:hypothetical protein